MKQFDIHFLIGNQLYTFMIKQCKLLIFCLVLNSYSIAQSFNIQLKVEGIDEVKGEICIGIYGNQEDYSNSKNRVWGDCIMVDDDHFEYLIEGIPAGHYAISIFQDIDINGELNTNWIGMPTEPFGFSNNAKMRMGPPKYEDASFEIKEDTETTINLIKL